MRATSKVKTLLLQSVPRDRRSKLALSESVPCIPFILSVKSTRLHTCRAWVTVTWRLGLRAPLVACNDIAESWIIDSFYWYLSTLFPGMLTISIWEKKREGCNLLWEYEAWPFMASEASRAARGRELVSPFACCSRVTSRDSLKWRACSEAIKYEWPTLESHHHQQLYQTQSSLHPKCMI